MKIHSIKCFKCGSVFTGRDKDRVIRENNLKKQGKQYYCECKIIDEIIKKRGRKKSDIFQGQDIEERQDEI